MLFLGPLTTQMIAMAAYTSQSANAHHAHHQIVDQASQQHHSSTSIPTDEGKHSKAPSHHNMNDCGYCDLVHSPALFTYTPTIAHAPPRFALRIAYHTTLIFLPLYNTPATRAPPSFS